MKKGANTRVFLVVEDSNFDSDPIKQHLEKTFPGCEVKVTGYLVEAQEFIKERFSEIDGITIDGSFWKSPNNMESSNSGEFIRWFNPLYQDKGQARPITIICAGGTPEDSEEVAGYEKRFYDCRIAKKFSGFGERLAAMMQRKLEAREVSHANALPGVPQPQVTASEFARTDGLNLDYFDPSA